MMNRRMAYRHLRDLGADSRIEREASPPEVGAASPEGRSCDLVIGLTPRMVNPLG